MLRSAAMSKYRPPPRAQDRRPAGAAHDAHPTMLQFVVLSMCLHVLAILLFGAPSGGTREGRAMWGSLQVELAQSYRDVLPGLKIDRALDALRKDLAPKPAPPRRAAKPAPAPPPVRLNGAKEIALPKVETTAPLRPAPSPPPAIAAPPPVATPAPSTAPVPQEAPPQLAIPPMLDRIAPPKLDRMETFTVPPPTQNQVITPTPAETKPAPVELKPLAPLQRIEAAPLAPMATPAELKPLPPAEPMKSLEPLDRIEVPPLPSLAPVERARIEPPPLPALPATPPVPPPPVESPALPVPRTQSTPPPLEAPVSRPVEQAPAVEAPAIPAVPSREAVPAAPPVPVAPPVNAQPALPSAPAVPSAPAREPAPAPATPQAPARESPEAAPSSLFRSAPPEGAASPRGYDPTKPALDLDSMRKRASQMAREGTGNRALLAFPMPPIPKEKGKLEKAIEKAWKPDCKTAYSKLGLAAVAPLVANEFGDGNCRW